MLEQKACSSSAQIQVDVNIAFFPRQGDVEEIHFSVVSLKGVCKFPFKDSSRNSVPFVHTHPHVFFLFNEGCKMWNV